MKHIQRTLVFLLVLATSSSCSEPSTLPPKITIDGQNSHIQSNSGSGIRMDEVSVTLDSRNPLGANIDQKINALEAKLCAYRMMRSQGVSPTKSVSFHFQNKRLDEALDELFPGVSFSFTDDAGSALIHDFEAADATLDTVFEHIDLAADVYFRCDEGLLVVTRQCDETPNK